jgi:hypothetical protein
MGDTLSHSRNARIGRFLPGLGPLAPSGGLFFALVDRDTSARVDLRRAGDQATDVAS